jgi:hypothetical protein
MLSFPNQKKCENDICELYRYTSSLRITSQNPKAFSLACSPACDVFQQWNLKHIWLCWLPYSCALFESISCSLIDDSSERLVYPTSLARAQHPFLWSGTFCSRSWVSPRTVPGVISARVQHSSMSSGRFCRTTCSLSTKSFLRANNKD